MTTLTSIRHDATHASRPVLLPRIAAWAALRRQRRQLAALDACALNDIGVTLNEARAEANRPFWDVPSVWRC
ncbi:MAG: hypothetical protein CSA70_10440 [Rhodobacterales bacterium]|nr:MAG: hypothetical protein CSA70_10440 [Rhodobacterales bacterium]